MTFALTFFGSMNPEGGLTQQIKSRSDQCNSNIDGSIQLKTPNTTVNIEFAIVHKECYRCIEIGLIFGLTCILSL
ncbi:MAG: hypothetical protein CL831_10435 [Crocinitomicaceae bacterium]|nr:hypothetical protein [Crocinitomicaceae bacterium]